MTRLASLLITLLTALPALAVEPLVVDLWPGKPPGDVGIPAAETTRIYQSPILGGPTKLVTNVTKPTLTIYPPAKAKWKSLRALLYVFSTCGPGERALYGVRTFTWVKTLARAASRWSKVTNASHPSAFARWSASAKSIPSSGIVSGIKSSMR